MFVCWEITGRLCFCTWRMLHTGAHLAHGFAAAPATPPSPDGCFRGNVQFSAAHSFASIPKWAPQAIQQQTRTGSAAAVFVAFASFAAGGALPLASRHPRPIQSTASFSCCCCLHSPNSRRSTAHTKMYEITHPLRTRFSSAAVRQRGNGQHSAPTAPNPIS